MAKNFQLISVFIGSPSGLEEERRAALRVVKEINEANSEHWGCQLKLVGWEETLPGHGRPQELINQDLDRCDYFVGVLFDHWGSPTGTGESKYSSGFQEEYERAKSRMEAGQMQDMTVYFREIPSERLRDPGQSLQRVMSFREECFAKKDALYKVYDNIQDFESKVRAKLTAIGWSEHELKRTKKDIHNKAEMPQLRAQAFQPTESDQIPLLDEKTKKFVTEILGRSSVWEETSSSDVARLRLVAMSLQRSGNDESVLGNHDANLIFQKRADIDLPDTEIRALLECGIKSFDHQNVPLWHWLSEYEKSKHNLDILSYLATFGNENQQSNAIRLLTLLGKQPPDQDEVITREFTIRRWMSKDGKPGVFASAIKFLQLHGMAADIPLLQDYFEKFTTQKRAAVGQAIIAIEAKVSETRAIERALKIGVDELSDLLVGQLFSHSSSLKTELLLKCIESPASGIRREAATILSERRELDSSVADTLLSDPDLAVRLCAVEALEMSGKGLNEDIVKEVLLDVKKTASAIASYAHNETDTTYYELYRRNRVLEKDFLDLDYEFEPWEFFSTEETEVLFICHTRKVQKTLRTYLEDGFEKYINDRFEKFKIAFGNNQSIVENAEKHIPYQRQSLVSVGLEALSELRVASDLSLIRSVVDTQEIYFSEALFSYFAKIGDWTDLPRIMKIKGFRLQDTKIPLVSRAASPVNEKAAAILSVSRTRIADLLSEDLEFMLRRAVMSGLSSKDVLGLEDDIIIQGLNHEDDKCRTLLALKCSQYLPKKRLKTLMDNYVNLEGYRYYNSIHWLDLGVSMSRSIAKSVAKHELANRA